jgi:hypothetical protein
LQFVAAVFRFGILPETLHRVPFAIPYGAPTSSGRRSSTRMQLSTTALS